MPVVATGTIVFGGSRSPVSGSRKSSPLRSTREMEPSSWPNLITSDCCVVTARMTICCWPLRTVSLPAPGLALGSVVPVSAGGGGSSVPTTCTPWSSALTLVPLTPATVVIVASSGLTVTTGKLVGGEADDHVDEVTGLGQRAHARHLVHLDRHADEAGGAVDVGEACRRARAEDHARDELAGRDVLARRLADDGRDIREAVDRLVALDHVLGRQVVGLDLRPQGDVLGGDDDRDLAEVRIGIRTRRSADCRS